MDTDVLSALSLALGLGLLIGLQRERAGSHLGGIRTFPLIALLGAFCGLLAYEYDYGALVAAAGFGGVAVLAILANLRTARSGDEAPGQTSEAAALLTYALGLFLATGQYAAAIVAGGVTAVLLHLKGPLHEFAGDLKERDVQAIMRFVIISLIILPLLPNEAYGPYEVLNPREIWFMVVLIVGISLTGYIAYKLFQSRAGLALGGLLGGLASSTATTVAYARRVKGTPGAMAVAAVIIAIAWNVSVARVILEVAVVAPEMLTWIGPPLILLLFAMGVATAGVVWFARASSDTMPEQENPAELKSALIFAAIYAAVIFATAAVKEHHGGGALYVVAFVSGLVDVDAVTLSTARLAAARRIDAGTAWQAILLASLANLGFKAGAVLLLGSGQLLLRLAPVILAAIAAGAALFLFWPVQAGS
jgi:uncharacterized membrane protein (DUF4010 family)